MRPTTPLQRTSKTTARNPLAVLALGTMLTLALMAVAFTAGRRWPAAALAPAVRAEGKLKSGLRSAGVANKIGQRFEKLKSAPPRFVSKKAHVGPQPACKAEVIVNQADKDLDPDTAAVRAKSHTVHARLNSVYSSSVYSSRRDFQGCMGNTELAMQLILLTRPARCQLLEVRMRSYEYVPRRYPGSAADARTVQKGLNASEDEVRGENMGNGDACFAVSVRSIDWHLLHPPSSAPPQSTHTCPRTPYHTIAEL